MCIRDSLYVATGFGKWGMTSSMAAAMILSDLITDQPNPDAEVFSPQRMHWGASLSNLLSGGGHTAAGWLKRLFYVPISQADQLARGEGGIVNYQGKKAGVYKDEEGNVYAVSIRCPHLGCPVSYTHLDVYKRQTVPLWILKHLISCPPMSMTNWTSGIKLWAAVRWATVSTMP